MKRCQTTVRVLRLRVKDRHAADLAEKAKAVNLVWNYCNELAYKVLQRERRWIGWNELSPYLTGASKAGLAVGSAVFQEVGEQYLAKRRTARRAKLAWRKSGGARRSLGWVPFKARSLRYDHGQVFFQGRWYSLWDSYGLGQYTLRSGSFSEDARGRWYLNVCVEVPAVAPTTGQSAVGLDLGLKEFCATSDGTTVEAPQFYRDLEPALATAQRANQPGRTRALHAKIGNRRKDFLHKLSTTLVREHGAIFVGNVNAAGLAKGPHAKSVLDAGWSAFRAMLRYKCADAGAWFEEVDEAFSTQTCSACGARGGPKGLEGLRIREWTCPCGATHQRDVNAARNILAAGHRRPVVGIPVL